MGSKKILKFSFKLLITLGFSIWVIYFVNWKDVWFYFSQIEPAYLIIYLAILFLGFLISAYKWKMLAGFKGISGSLGEFFQLYFIATFINNFMPSFVAGDAYKAYQIGKKESLYSRAVSSIIMDRLTGLIGTIILALTAGLLQISIVLNNKILLITEIILIIILLAYIILPKLKQIIFLKEWLIGLLPKKIQSLLKDIEGLSKNHIIFKSIAISILFSLIGVALLNYILFISLGIEIALAKYLLVIFIVTIISAVPISINNIGVKEWAYITFFGLFGINPAAVITVAILSRTVQMVVSFFALPMYLKRKK